MKLDSSCNLGLPRLRTGGFLLLFLFLMAPGLSAGEDLLALQAKRIYLGDGRAIEGGSVLVREGKIVSVGRDIALPEGARVIRLETGTITPGLVDASSAAGILTTDSWAEHSSEVIPHMKVIDAVDLRSRDFRHLAEIGVSTVYITPDSASVIGSQGAVVKTAGPLPPASRVIREAWGIKASISSDSFRRGTYNQPPRGAPTFLTRRPTTRMGVAWVFEKAFYDARKYLSSPKKEKDPALEVLAAVLQGEVPLRMMARTHFDIQTALRLAREFNLRFTLEEGFEAYRCVEDLKKYRVPVVFGPIFDQPSGFRRRSGEADNPCLNGAGILAEGGVVVALTAGGQKGEDALPFQAGYALRYGMPFQEVLKAVTLNPARIMNLEERLGTLDPGKDADLVLWSGEPFQASTRAEAVVVNGQVVYESRFLKQEEKK